MGRLVRSSLLTRGTIELWVNRLAWEVNFQPELCQLIFATQLQKASQPTLNSGVLIYAPTITQYMPSGAINLNAGSPNSFMTIGVTLTALL